MPEDKKPPGTPIEYKVKDSRFRPLEHSQSSWFVYVAQLSPRFTRKDRDTLIAMMGERGIECRAYFPPIHQQPVYLKQSVFDKVHLPVTESVADRTLALPFYRDMTHKEVETVCKELAACLG